MCLIGALLRRVLVVVILANSSCKIRCNYKEVLDSYQAIVLVELKTLNLKGLGVFNNIDLCPSGKAGRILGSIYSSIQRTRCHVSERNSSQLETPLKNMERLIVLNCNQEFLRGTISCSSVQRLRGKKRKRRRLIKVIKSLVICWQKLQNVANMGNTH
ncbi:uncharacterized protein ACB058_018260 [Synchiropus picturatus]